LIVGLFAFLLLPKLIGQLRDLYDRLPMLLNLLSEKFSPYSQQYFGYDIFTQWHELAQAIIPAVARPAGGILESFLSGTLKALSALLMLTMIPILTFYFLKEYRQFNQALLQLVPRRYLPDVQEVIRRLSIVLGALIRGQFLVCLILSALYSIALTAVGIDVALVLGVFSGFMNLIPFIGPLLSMALAILFALLGGGGLAQCIAIFGVYVLANLVESTLLTPRIVGKQVGISPLVIILGLLAGGELLGFIGVLLALPILAMAKVLGGYLRERYLSSDFYRQNNDSAT
jgi:phosphoribosylaminoimidazole-succinocarboxamide synthase